MQTATFAFFNNGAVAELFVCAWKKNGTKKLVSNFY
jgi:hypothetical protein